MINDIFPNLPQITLQNNHDGPKDFTLQMTCTATASGTQFEILFIGETTNNKNSLPAKSTPLTLVNTVIINETVSNHQLRR